MDKQQEIQTLLGEISNLIKSAYQEGWRQAPNTKAEEYGNSRIPSEKYADQTKAIVIEKINKFVDTVCGSAGGALPYKATSKRVVYKNTKRVVYKGVRGGSYIKVNGKFVNIRNLKL